MNSQTKLLAKSMSSCPPAARLRLKPMSDVAVSVFVSVGKPPAPVRA